MNLSRESVLNRLVNLDGSLHESIAALRGFAWDSPQSIVSLTPAQVSAVLSRFLAGTLEAKDIEAWAEAIEGRDDIGYSPDEPAGLAIHELANPLITQPLTRQSAHVLMVLLGQ
jgi:hypothetical protein